MFEEEIGRKFANPLTCSSSCPQGGAFSLASSKATWGTGGGRGAVEALQINTVNLLNVHLNTIPCG